MQITILKCTFPQKGYRNYNHCIQKVHWNAFEPTSCKRGDLNVTLPECAWLICLTDQLLKKQLKHLEKIFPEY